MLIIFLSAVFALLVSTPIGAEQQISKQLTLKPLMLEKLSPKQLTHESLTIDDAVQRALKYRPDLKAMSYAVQSMESEAKSERAGYFPTIGLTSDVFQEKGDKALNSNNIISVNQQIYSFAGPLQKYQKAKNAVQISELDRVIATNQIRWNTEKIFLDAWLVQAKEKSISALKISTQKTFQLQEHRNRLKKLDKDVWLKNVADCATSMAQVDQYKDEVTITFKKLEFLMGESLALLPLCTDSGGQCQPRVQLTWHYKKNHKLEPLETYYHYALTNRPEVPQGLKRMEIQKWNIRLEQGSRLPVIAASAQASCITNPNNNQTLNETYDPEILDNSGTFIKAIKTSWELRLSLNWSIFDGLVSQYREQQAEADKIREALTHEQDILNIRQQVHEFYYSLEKVLKRLDAERLKYIQGRNHFKLKKQEFAIGRISQVDFDAAKSDWQTVKFDWLSYNVQIEQAECDLMYACGYPERI